MSTSRRREVLDAIGDSGVEFAKIFPGEIPGPAFVVISQESQP